MSSKSQYQNFFSIWFTLLRRSDQSGGLFTTLFKPYVLELLNSRAVSKIKTTPCWPNMHFLLSNPEIHYLALLPVARAIFTSRIPQFQEWLLNLKKGPSAAKGKFVIIIIRHLHFSLQITHFMFNILIHFCIFKKEFT